MIPLEFEADRGFFTQLLCGEGETLEDELFDFDPPAAKRAAFAKIRGDILRQRVATQLTLYPPRGEPAPIPSGGR